MIPSLQEAIDLVNAGQKERARVLLMQIIRQDPHNETAWLWLVDCLPDDAQRVETLETCLKFNPNSRPAQIALNALLAEKGAPDEEISRLDALAPPHFQEPENEFPASTEQPEALLSTEPPAFDVKPGSRAGDYPIQGNISDDFMRELESQADLKDPPLPSTPAAVLPAALPYRPETIPAAPVAEDELLQTLRGPQVKSRRAPRPRPASLESELSTGRFRWVFIALFTILVILVVATGIILGLSNLQITGLPSNPANQQALIETGVAPQAKGTVNKHLTTTPQFEDGTPTPAYTSTPTSTPAPPLPTGLSGAVVQPILANGPALPMPFALQTASQLIGGRVLLAGGFFPEGASGNTMIYDPASNQFTLQGSLVEARYGHSAAVLSNGKVVTAAGRNQDVFLSSAEIFDPASGSWTLTRMLASHGTGSTATALQNDWVLVAGGCSSSGATDQAELLDPDSQTWVMVKPMPGKRCNHTATLLPDGRVLIIGSTPDAGEPDTLLYDPIQKEWKKAASMRSTRSNHTATLLPDGRVLVIGGKADPSGALASIEIYDPAKDSWTELSSMNQARFDHATVLLPDSRVAVFGGASADASFLDSLEVYFPGSNTWSELTPLGLGFGSFSATLLPQGRVLIAGGITADQVVQTSSKILIFPKVK